jgi:DNA repair protein RadC
LASVEFLNEIKVQYEHKPVKIGKGTIKRSEDVIPILKEIYNLDRITYQEEVVVLMFDFSQKLIGYFKLSSGGLTSTIVDTRLLFSVALKSLATGVILSHNHPSGNLKPSSQDIEMTKRLYEAAKIMEINVLDHIIVSPDPSSFYSFADHGQI